ncbi:single stranded DNA-binding protein [Leeuwenhoekiella aestuarii]|uniref:Single-stranded DNA-binding protein n=2 Tax=Leeuwenhoekiella aestuarii TaxID=2249426 RepID=A0A4Q0NNL6_9FLAO|nr:single stranded DNA-binding protein [Leeuwenhoekiella aestuarii]
MYQQQKKVTAIGTNGSKSKMNLMKSVQNITKEAGSKKHKTKKENAQDNISKSFFKSIKAKCLKGLGSIFNHLNFRVMSTLRNQVQLIGNVGQEPTLTTLESGKKVVRFSLATNEFYKNTKGEKTQDTQWHTVVAWGKTAELIENYVPKGKELALTGKLKSRSYVDSAGLKRNVTEVEASEIVLLGSKSE